jgi:tetraacyldisaccharide 4'-kinase
MHLEPGRTLHPLLNGGLNLLSLAYKGGAALQRGWRRRHRRSYPGLFIVSVDNLSFGGTGKTPFIIALGEEMERCGLRFAVVCRGYRSRLERTGGEVRVGDGPERVGDEAVLLKNRFPGQVVLVGRDRHQSLRAASGLGCQAVIVDDGFQSADIAVDIRVLLVNPDQPYYYLRHFLSARRCADQLLFFRSVPPDWKERAGVYDFFLEGLFDPDGRRVEAGGAPLAAFSALADNARFCRDLMSRWSVAAFRGFADHHAYTCVDLQALERMRRECGAPWLVCSEKDFVKVRGLERGDIPFLHTRNRIQLPPDMIGSIVHHAEEEARRHP